MSLTVSLSRSSYTETLCSITLDPIVDLPDPCRILPCGHFFSEKELAAWRAIRSVCPMDGGTITKIEQVQFIDFVEEAPKEIEILHMAAATKSDAIAAKQLLQTSLHSVEDFKQLKIVAERGDIDAQFEVAKTYFEGIVIHRNFDEGEKWLKMAAKNGHREAQRELHAIYFQGDGMVEW